MMSVSGAKKRHCVSEGCRPRAVARDEDAQAAPGAGDIAHHQGVETLRRARKLKGAGRVGDPSNV